MNYPIPPLPDYCNSWVVIRLSTGKAVFETWNPDVIAALDPTKALALTTADYLGQLNARIREGKEQ